MAGLSRPSTSLNEHAKCQPRRLITSPRRFPMPTAPPHIGHAYERIATDVMARFARLDGTMCFSSPAWTSTGRRCSRRRRARVDAAGAGRPQRAAIRRDGRPAECAADDIVRTTAARHREAVQEIWKRMEANGDIYLSNIPAGIRCATRPTTTRTRSKREGKKYSTQDRNAGGMGGGGKLFLQALGLSPSFAEDL